MNTNLLSEGKSIHEKLYKFVKLNDLKEVEKILKDNIVSEKMNSHFNISLNISCASGQYDMVKLFLEYYKYNSYLSARKTHLEFAAENGKLDVFKLILSHTSLRGDEHNNTSLHLASEHGHFHIVEFMLGCYYIKPESNKNRAIRAASCNGHIEIVKILLKDKRVDPSDFYNESIRNSTYSDYTEITQLLWEDLTVKNSLKNNDEILYNKLMQQDIKNKVREF